MRNLLFLVMTIVVLMPGCSKVEDAMANRHPSSHNFNPAEGVVPDEATATKVAEIVLKRAYGDAVINRELPLHAALRGDDVWVVRGTWQYSSGDRGGVAVVEISKKDCQVVRLSHGM